ncbi:MAG: 2-C-methyl-D-erythritol 4-phosphate cytidylyltransferase [Lacisediminihabitans sp.]
MSAPSIGVILVAAGSGARLGTGEPKAFVRLGGVSILERALSAVTGMVEPAQVVLVVPAERLDAARLIVAATRWGASEAVVVSGGDTRQRSVVAGMAALASSVETVLVHDAARALTPSALFDEVIAAVRATGAGVIPALAVSDTIKQTDAGGLVERTLDRSSLVAVQTPQGFPRGQLVDAYAEVAEDFTDDAAVFAAAGHPVTVIDGDELAFKITTASDLRRAEGMTGSGQTMRTGIGMDVHAFDENVPLWLGGLYWPDEPGLSGHSDGDALSHAVCDSLLSAAGLGDLGSNFGTEDPRFAAAHGDVFLEATVRLVTDAGYSIGNVAVQLVGNRPKIGARRAELEQRLSAVIGAPVSVAATTSDGLGFTGAGEGVAVMASALLHRDR